MYLLTSKKEKGDEEGNWEKYVLGLKIWLFRLMQ